MPLVYSKNFGGNPSMGDAATEAGIDCIIVVPASAQIIAINRIIAHYGLASINDWERKAAVANQGWRSFSGRLIVFETLPGYRPENITTGGPPSQLLSNPLPDTIAQRILFDKMIHKFPMEETAFEFEYSGGGSLLSRSGYGLGVILVAGSGFDDTGVQSYFTRQLLHVESQIISISQDIQLGKYSTKS